MSRSRNVYFQFVDVDLTLPGTSGYALQMFATKDGGIEYSRIHSGGIRTNPNGLGWLYNSLYLMDIRNIVADKVERIKIDMNRIERSPPPTLCSSSGRSTPKSRAQCVRECRWRLHPYRRLGRA